MLTGNYFLSLFPERQSQLSTSRTARKWLGTKADEWDIFPKKQGPGKAVPTRQEGVQKSQAHPAEAGWRTGYKHKTSIHPSALTPWQGKERLRPSSSCLSNTTSCVSEEQPASSHWCQQQNPKTQFLSTVALFNMQRDGYTDVLLTYYFTLFNHRIIVRIAELMLSHSHSYALFNWEQSVIKEKDFSQVWLFSSVSSYKLVAAPHLLLTTQINLSKFLLTGDFWQKTPSDWSSLRSSSRDISVCQSHTHNHATHHAMCFLACFSKIST